MEGPGTLFADDSIFTGTMIQGKKDFGILKMINGNEYHGKFN
jgi:hypothetical protein